LYRVDQDKIRFEPRFPLASGLRYRAEFNPIALDALTSAIAHGHRQAGTKPVSTPKLVADLSVPELAATPTTSVTNIYPSRAIVPENLLRFYIHFSAPMSRGESYRHLRLLDASGKPMDAPFLELHEELWSTDGTRFTLLFDPGRIKRGLKPREEVGPILEAGKAYTLVIDPDWRDATGRPLAGGFRKSFRAEAPDNRSPDPMTWTVRSPRTGTRDALEVHFPEPLDRALLDRLIVVQNTDAQVLPGRVLVDGEETIWRWVPMDSWRAGKHHLVIGSDLEDLAGNSIARPFEVDLTGPISRRLPNQTVVVAFWTRTSPE
jgi:hypothetical protein